MLLSVVVAPPARPVVVAYVPNWIDLDAFARTIDYSKVTHLDVAFENPTNDAGTLSFNPADFTLVKRAHAHGVKVLVSLGGATTNDDPVLRRRSLTLIDPAHRAAYVGKLARYVAARGFDGLDVDLEGAAIDADYGPFVRDLGKALASRGKLLTAALSMGNGGDRVPLEALKSLDYLNVMAYDATGPWDPGHPGPHASFEYAKDSIDFWRTRGVPRAKLVLGVPFYGHGFGAAAKGDWSYAKIVATYPGADKSDRIGNTIWYNGPATIRAKARWVRAEGLAGMMIWSLDSDASGEASLLAVLDRGLRAGP